MSKNCDCNECNREEDHITLSTGKRYAFGRVVGLSLDLDDNIIYYGHDGYVGEFEDSLTNEEKQEICNMMISKWTEYLEKLHE